MRSTDAGVSWSFASSTSIPFPFMLGNMAFSSSNVGWLIVNDKLRRTTDGGMTWQDIPGAYTCLNDITFPNSTTVIALTCDGSMQRSLDGGQTWQWVFFDAEHGNVQVAFAKARAGRPFNRLPH